MRWIERLAGVADLATVTGLQICCRPVLCIRALPVDAAPRLLLLELSFILVLLLALGALLEALVALGELAERSERVGAKLVQDAGDELGELLVLTVAVKGEGVGRHSGVDCAMLVQRS